MVFGFSKEDLVLLASFFFCGSRPPWELPDCLCLGLLCVFMSCFMFSCLVLYFSAYFVFLRLVSYSFKLTMRDSVGFLHGSILVIRRMPPAESPLDLDLADTKASLSIFVCFHFGPGTLPLGRVCCLLYREWYVVDRRFNRKHRRTWWWFSCGYLLTEYTRWQLSELFLFHLEGGYMVAVWLERVLIFDGVGTAFLAAAVHDEPIEPSQCCEMRLVVLALP